MCKGYFGSEGVAKEVGHMRHSVRQTRGHLCLRPSPQVCSPGGTTIAGVEALELSNFRACAMRAVAAAAKRSAEMRLAAAPPQAKL